MKETYEPIRQETVLFEGCDIITNSNETEILP